LGDFSGIGQEELTLKNKEMDYIDDFIDSLEECKDSVEFLDLSIQKIFIRKMIMKLGLSSTRDSIAEHL